MLAGRTGAYTRKSSRFARTILPWSRLDLAHSPIEWGRLLKRGLLLKLYLLLPEFWRQDPQWTRSHGRPLRQPLHQSSSIQKDTCAQKQSYSHQLKKHRRLATTKTTKIRRGTYWDLDLFAWAGSGPTCCCGGQSGCWVDSRGNWAPHLSFRY